MTNDAATFLHTLNHARTEEIEAVRAIIMSAKRDITERIKWNAPSYCHEGDDRITFRLQPGDRVQLIFHRGAKKRNDTFTFDDVSGLIEWAAPDRGIVTFRSLEEVHEKSAALKALVEQWLDATRHAG